MTFYIHPYTYPNKREHILQLRIGQLGNPSIGLLNIAVES